MSSIKLGTNVASLLVQRNLATATSKLQTNFERLSSGLRINSAKDDAAGLAMAESLNADARVFTQAVRNVNDGISLLNIAEASLRELSSIVTRQIELSEQAGNGTLSLRERQALHKEANALVDEYNRIVSSTEFNNIGLLDGTEQQVVVQAGATSTDSISVKLAEQFERTAGDGTFNAQVSYAVGEQPVSVATMDFDNDGNMDMVTADGNGDTISVLMGNGDGTFNAGVSYATGAHVFFLTVGDFDNNGTIDIVTSDNNTQSLSFYSNDGTGSFSSRQSSYIHLGPADIYSEDFNGDGILDMAVSSPSVSNIIGIALGNGDGSFAQVVSVAIGDKTASIEGGDFNGDGIVDLAVGTESSSQVSILYGDGQGDFSLATKITTGSDPRHLAVSDFNLDGYDDVLTLNYVGDSVTLFLGDGEGSFTQSTSISAGAPHRAAVGDYNGDGIPDVAVTEYDNDQMTILLGAGDGTFDSSNTFATYVGPTGDAVADFNNDGVLDLVATNSTAGTNSVSVLLGSSQTLTTMQKLNLLTQDDALTSLTTGEETLERITLELGAVGAAQSRFAHTISNLQQIRENYLTAESQIRDADIAAEAAELVRNQILQQAAASVLAQANQQSDIVLVLLSNSNQ